MDTQGISSRHPGFPFGALLSGNVLTTFAFSLTGQKKIDSLTNTRLQDLDGRKIRSSDFKFYFRKLNFTDIYIRHGNKRLSTIVLWAVGFINCTVGGRSTAQSVPKDKHYLRIL